MSSKWNKYVGRTISLVKNIFSFCCQFVWNRCERLLCKFCFHSVSVRFILDDSALYLSDKCETDVVDLRRGKTHDVLLEIQLVVMSLGDIVNISGIKQELLWGRNHCGSLCHTDYVCVLDIDLLELAITTWKGGDSGKLVSELHLCTYLCVPSITLGSRSIAKQTRKT